MRSFNETVIISIKYSQPSILLTVHFSDIKTWSHPIFLTHSLSAYFRTLTMKQTSYRIAYIFRAALIIKMRAAT